MARDPALRRLTAADAASIVACFRRVYGDSYGNALFYDEARLGEALTDRRLRAVGAERDGQLLAHMAMTLVPGATVPELGNTVVAPEERGGGLAWRVGAELTAWCRQLGYAGFLHYPTTDHHIMQRQSVRAGFETGLMLGYIPAETHGQVRKAHAAGRQAATIVYEPLAPSGVRDACKPEYLGDLLDELTAATSLKRRWRSGGDPLARRGRVSLRDFERRGLARLQVASAGADLAAEIAKLKDSGRPCRQIDFSLDDPAVDAGISVARAAGFGFCGWLPGHLGADALRLQHVDLSVTDLNPALENETARRLLARFLAETEQS